MMAEDDFLHGCYQHLWPLDGESFAGYLLRLASANSYSGIADFLKTTFPRKLPSDLGKALYQLRSSKDDLSILGKVGAGASGALLRFYWVELLDGAVFYQDCRIEPDALLARSAQACPICLGESGVASEDWDLAPVVACPRHHVGLVDTCTCGAPLSWGRHELHFCNCGNDIRTLPVETASPEVTGASADFAALAPFRVRLSDRTIQTIRWDSTFNIAKACSLAVRHWTSDVWPESAHFRGMPVSSRAAAVSLVGRCNTEGTYDLLNLDGKLLIALAPLEALPVTNLMRARGFNLLFSKAALPRDVVTTIVGHEPPEHLTGAETFAGRPPVLGSRADVVRFLGIDDATFAGLLTSKVIYEPSGADIGFDIDVVLHAARFLQEGLLNLEQLGEVAGVPAEADAIRRSLLVRPWNSKAALDMRVELAQVEAIQLRLIEIVADSRAPDDAVRLGDVAPRMSRAFDWILQTVGRVLDGQANRLHWTTPYRWSDLWVEKGFLPVCETGLLAPPTVQDVR